MPQSAYVAANEVADLIVQGQNRSGAGAWFSARWDLWANTELWANMRWEDWQAISGAEQGTDTVSRVARATKLAIEPAEGVHVFERLLAMPARQVVISTYDLAVRQAAASDVATSGDSTDDDGTTFARPELDPLYVPPEDDLELRMASIWQQVLGVEGLGRNDDFFELGGHSLMAAKLIS